VSLILTHRVDGLITATRYRTYAFSEGINEEGVYQVAATDRAANLGTAPFTVTRDTTPPTFTLSPAVESGALRVTWSSSDAASGVDGSTCELRVQEDDGAWQPFSTDCAGDEVHSEAQPGHVYTFRLSATDNVSNSATAEALAHFPRVTKYYYHPSTGSGQAGGQRVAMRADGVVYYLHGDHLGSTSLTTDASGAVVARQFYHPYGTVRHSEGTLPTNFGFTGQRHDGSTGLIFMHARYYHAGLGRFTQADTIVPQPGNPQDFNRYAYVRNNPVLYRDPSGHAADSYGNRWSVVDDPLAEPPSPEKVRETAVFLAVGVPAAVFGGPVLGDLAAVGWAGAKALAWKALAWAATHPVEAIVGKAVAEETIESVGTGTPFDPRNVLLDVVTQVDDDMLPRRQYSVAYEMELDSADYGMSRATHRRRASDALYGELQADAGFQAGMEKLIPGATESAGSRRVPQGWQWHHAGGPDDSRGVRMQLVPVEQHTSGSPWWDVLHPEGYGAFYYLGKYREDNN